MIKSALLYDMDEKMQNDTTLKKDTKNSNHTHNNITSDNTNPNLNVTVVFGMIEAVTNKYIANRYLGLYVPKKDLKTNKNSVAISAPPGPVATSAPSYVTNVSKAPIPAPVPGISGTAPALPPGADNQFEVNQESRYVFWKRITKWIECVLTKSVILSRWWLGYWSNVDSQVAQNDIYELSTSRHIYNGRHFYRLSKLSTLSHLLFNVSINKERGNEFAEITKIALKTVIVDAQLELQIQNKSSYASKASKALTLDKEKTEIKIKNCGWNCKMDDTVVQFITRLLDRFDKTCVRYDAQKMSPFWNILIFFSRINNDCKQFLLGEKKIMLQLIDYIEQKELHEIEELFGSGYYGTLDIKGREAVYKRIAPYIIGVCALIKTLVEIIKIDQDNDDDNNNDDSKECDQDDDHDSNYEVVAKELKSLLVMQDYYIYSKFYLHMVEYYIHCDEEMLNNFCTIMIHASYNNQEFCDMFGRIVSEGIYHCNRSEEKLNNCFTIINKVLSIQDDSNIMEKRFTRLMNCDKNDVAVNRGESEIEKWLDESVLDMTDLVNFYRSSNFGFRLIERVLEIIQSNKQFSKFMFSIRDKRWKQWDNYVKQYQVTVSKWKYTPESKKQHFRNVIKQYFKTIRINT